ncbi:MAG: hypothetical protein HC893_16140, partial [Chloroflexaceae bacterium]|nr:hypothetical protein [Chloroflexaceae bacterium]
IEDVLVIIDANATDLDVVYCGVGRSDRTLELRLVDLIHITGAQICAIVRDAHDDAER